MKRSIQRSTTCRYRRIGIHERRASLEDGSRRGVHLVIGVEEEEDVESLKMQLGKLVAPLLGTGRRTLARTGLGL